MINLNFNVNISMLSIGVKVEFYNIGLYCTSNILQMQVLKTKYVITTLSICNISLMLSRDG